MSNEKNCPSILKEFKCALFEGHLERHIDPTGFHTWSLGLGTESESKPEFKCNIGAEINRIHAYRQDKNDKFYAENDEACGWGVFGSESGFCYHLPGSESEAKELAREMNQGPDGASGT